MRKILKSYIILFLILFFGLQSFATNNSLPSKYKKWLNLVSYIITPQEKNVFLMLKNNRERDTFIKLFWKQRDPTPGTPENEFKEEHIKRFNYANKYFKYQSTKPGWKTDMGRIYIILGPPVSREKIDSFGLYPMEVWYYYGDTNKGLPPYFRIVFFKKYGGGEFQIYDPAIDGPDSLLIRSTKTLNIDPFDYPTLYDKISELSPSAAEPAISLIPGDIPFNYQPSPFNSILISNVLESAKKNIKTNYARDFLNFKGVVKVEYAMNYVEAKNRVEVFKDFETGMNFVHFIIYPKRISVDYSKDKDKYYFSYRLTVSLNKNGKMIYQYSKIFPFYFDEEELKTKVAKGFVIEDMFPIVPGKFKLTVLIQNSVKKEFSYFEKEIKIKSEKYNLPILYGPIISYKIDKENTFLYHPYKINNYNISIDPKNMFSPTNDLKLFFCLDNSNYTKNINVKMMIKNKLGYNKFFKQDSFSFNKKSKCFIRTIKNPGPGSYIARISLYSTDNIPFTNKETYFTISPINTIIHPTLAYKTIKKENIFIYYQSIGSQFLKIGNTEKAFEAYSKAYSLKKDFIILNKEFAELLLSLKKYKKAMEVIENINTPQNKFDYYFLRGKLFFNKKQYHNALNNFLKANNLYDSDYSLINYIALCYYNLKEYDKAIKAFKASYLLNKNQNNIKRIIERIKKMKDNK